MKKNIRPNKSIDFLVTINYRVWDIAKNWVPYVIGERAAINVALDWTSFAADAQETVCINLLTTHGRATPLLWHTVKQSQLKNNRARYEDQLLSRLKDSLPDSVKVTVMADRGFASYKFFEFLGKDLGFSYVVRIQSNTTITNPKNIAKKAREWLRTDGRALNIKNAKLTKQGFPVAQAIVVKDKNMKQAWFLVTNHEQLKTREIINLYAKRWKIEPYFRDVKDQRYGFGLKETHIRSPKRRDRLLLIVALAYVLLTLLGAAGESIGFDKFLKVNTVKTRTHSLIRQGMFYYDFFQNFKPPQQMELLRAFNTKLKEQHIWEHIFFVI